MKPFSDKAKAVIQYRRDFYPTITMTFHDGRVRELGRDDLSLTGSGFTDAAESGSFPIGVAMEKQISFSLINDDQRWVGYNFYGAKCNMVCNLDLDDGTVEQTPLGTYTIISPETYGTIIDIVAVDDMYKGDVPYETALTYPATVGQILRDSCTTCGVDLLTTTFDGDDFVVNTPPENITHRALWGYCAMLAGGNARMDGYNRLSIVTFDKEWMDEAALDGGNYDLANRPYASGDVADGGLFFPWETGYECDSGQFTGKAQVMDKCLSASIATDNVVITGIGVDVSDRKYMFGVDGYVLMVTNPLIEADPQTGVNTIGEKLVGVNFRPFTIDHIAYPYVEFGDACYVYDNRMTAYKSVVTDVAFTFFGNTTIKCQADDPIRNSARYSSQSTATVVTARREAKKQLKAYDQSIQLLTKLMSESFGVFKTEEVQADGSVIYYMHNKPDKASSTNIWKMTSEGFTVSTDGGNTWNAGIDAAGNATVNVLSAIGINAEWIRAEDLQAIGATIGGWQIESDGIIKRFNIYPNMTAAGLSNVANDAPVQYVCFMKRPTTSYDYVFGVAYISKANYLNGSLTMNYRYGVSADGEIFVETPPTAMRSKITLNREVALGSYTDVQKSQFDYNGLESVHYASNYTTKPTDVSEACADHVSDGLYVFDVDSTGNKTYPVKAKFARDGIISKSTYDYTVGNSGNLVILGDNGTFARSSSSSARYKEDITENLPSKLDPHKLYDLPVKSYKYKDGYLHNSDCRNGQDIIGFIAEDVQKVYECATEYDENGKAEMWNAKIIVPAMLKLIQEQNDRIAALERLLEDR